MTIDIGILSTAHLHAGAYAPLLERLAAVRFIGIADEDHERGEEFASEHDTRYRSRDDLLSEADGVIVCSTNTNRRDPIERAIEADVDILSEKPLATTATEATRLVTLCREAGVTLDVAMPLRHSVPAERARTALRDGQIGSLTAITGTNRGQLPGDWFLDPDVAGGGAVMDHTVHVVDLVHWLTGERVAEVYAETTTALHDVAVEDVNLLSMTLTDGTQFTLDGSWSKPDEWSFWGDATVELIGVDGVVSVDCFDEVVRETTDGIESVFWGTDPNERMLRRFSRTAAGDADPAVGVDDAIAAVQVIEAAYESAANGKAVSVQAGSG